MQKPPSPEEVRAHIIKRIEALKAGAWSETMTGQQAFEYMARCQDFFKMHGAKVIELLTPEKKEPADDKDKAAEGGAAAKPGG